MTEIKLITKVLNDAYKFVKEQEQTKETGELLINLFKAEILVKNCSIPAVVGRSEQCNHVFQRVERGGEFQGNQCECGE